MNTLVSVIVPIYNVEKYLDKCVTSICNQTYQNLEIILVDDGSPDQCGVICDQWQKKDKRIKVIHKENGGLSDARNAGIPEASGEYLVFVDSDDYIHPRMIELLLNACIKNNVLLAVCDVENVKEDMQLDYPEIKEQEINHLLIDSKQKMITYQYGEKNIEFTVAWNKIYHKSLFENICYPKGKIHEDEFTTYKLIYLAEKVVYIEVPLYYYVQREGSIMSEGFNKKSLYRLEAYEEKLKFYEQHHEKELYDETLKLYKIMLILYIHQINHAKDISIDILKPYLRSCKKSIRKVFWKWNISTKEKFGLGLFCTLTGLYVKRDQKRK